MAEIKISVIIPTYNRQELLGQVLDSLAKLESPGQEMEVIVVDDGSTDQTAQMLAGRHDPFVLRVFRHESSQGPAAARNHGAREASAEILGFVDSDVRVDRKWWKKARAHFQDPGVAGVEGVTLSPAVTSRPSPFTHMVSNTKGGQYLTCNMLYRKEVFWQAGGFDSRFLRANREDTDLAFSVLERGFSIVFDPEVKVEHPLFPAPWNVFLKETKYGLHEPLLRRKHPFLYRRCLKWIDGRAFPVFYWGIFFGLPALGLAALRGSWFWLAAGVVLFGLGWSGSVYAVCRKRRTAVLDVLILAAQYLLIPWLRLYWVARGEWKYRKVKANTAINPEKPDTNRVKK